jgi:MarR-like DNA-binding transcriptional regulator SgrR of sgrS sRNA
VTDNDRYAMLPKGESQAIKAADLRVMWGLSSQRAVRLVVHRMRCNGLIICTSDAGYYRPATQEDIQRTVRRLQSQARAMFRAANAASKRIKAG